MNIQEYLDNKKRAKDLRDDRHRFGLEMVVPVGEAGIKSGLELNMDEDRSSRT
jgi:hypothetical protein